MGIYMNIYQPAQEKVQGTAWPIDAVLFAVQDAYTDKQLHLWDVSFSADSQQFAVATTHGTFVFSQVQMVMGWGRGKAQTFESDDSIGAFKIGQLTAFQGHGSVIAYVLFSDPGGCWRANNIQLKSAARSAMFT